MPGIHIQLTPEDEPYVFRLKNILQGRAKATINYEPVITASDGIFRNKKNGHSTPLVATTSSRLLQLITRDDKAKIKDFAGSIINYKEYDHLFLPPLKQLMTVPYGDFITKRYFKKFLQPKEWLSIPEFKWELFEPSRFDYLLSVLQTATFISVDIENDYPEETRYITCIGFTAVRIDPISRAFTATTVVVPFTDLYNREVIRQFLQVPSPKVFQNGKFDNAYLLRFALPVCNYAFDTINLFHSWYSELPKRLDFITSFMLRDWVYWKDEAANAIGSMEYYQYNAKDAFTTAMDFLALMSEMPDFAIENYKKEFPTVFPCILSEMQGIKIDVSKKQELEREIYTKWEAVKTSLRIMVDEPKYNPGSPQQNLQVWKALGSEDITSTDEQSMDKVKARHPLNKRIVSSIDKAKEYGSALSKYIAKDFVWNNRCFYAINPHGTDTGRCASRESHFNCGLQIQNISRDNDEFKVKDMFIADEGFYLGEADYKQNESWGQAYLSGDKELIRIVEDQTKDFHGLNASKFFGVSYDTIVKSVFENNKWDHKVLDKPLRNLSKRTNHGAVYNMAAGVLLDTMGIENVLRAKKLLGLPRHFSLLDICQYLLDQFDKTFPVVRGENYNHIRAEVTSTGMLVGPTAWTRVCFSDPSKNKRSMNMYAAHRPQSLAAMVLNQAYIRVFNEVWMRNKNDFKLCAQIHDSILFQYRIGSVDLCRKVANCMDIHTNVTDIFGVKHDLNVPVDLKGESNRWSELRSL